MPKRSSESESKAQELQNLHTKVIKLYDEFIHFSGQCAFLCDAFAAISAQQAAQEDFVESQTVAGIQYYSHWLKTRVLEIKGELRQVHEQVRELKRL